MEADTQELPLKIMPKNPKGGRPPKGFKVDTSGMPRSQDRAAPKEIAYSQQNLHVQAVEPTVFRRIAKDILRQFKDDARMSSAGLETLQAAMESYFTGGLAAQHRGHATVEPRDLALYGRMQDINGHTMSSASASVPKRAPKRAAVQVKTLIPKP